MHRSWSRVFALAMGIPLLLAFLAACGGSGTGSNSPTPTSGVTTGTIKIATELPVSGGDTSSGKPIENGAHLAIDEANAANAIPGYKLVFVAKDDVGASGTHDPTVGAKNVTDLIGDALVAGIVGPYNSGVAKAEMPITNQAPIALISPSNTNQCLTKEGADIGCAGANDIVPTLRPSGKVNYFRIATTDDHQGGVAADYLYKTLKVKTVYVVDDTETYGVGIANAFSKEFQADGGKILGHDSVKSTTDYTGVLTKIAAAHPQVIYYGGVDSTGGTQIRKQMVTTNGLQKIPFVGGDGIQTSAFATTVGTKIGGSVYSTVAAVDATKVPSAADFIKKYEATYGPLGAYSAGGYDCAKILINAIKAAIAAGAKPPTSSNDTDTAKTFRQAVIDQVAKTDYNGVTGHHSFDQNGDTANKTISIYQLADISGQPNWKYLTAQTLP